MSTQITVTLTSQMVANYLRWIADAMHNSDISFNTARKGQWTENVLKYYELNEQEHEACSKLKVEELLDTTTDITLSVGLKRCSDKQHDVLKNALASILSTRESIGLAGFSDETEFSKKEARTMCKLLNTTFTCMENILLRSQLTTNEIATILGYSPVRTSHMRQQLLSMDKEPKKDITL